MSIVSIWRGAALSLLIVGASLTGPAQAAEAPFVFQEQERVVFLGATMLEREQEEGYLETLLTARFAEKNLSFRNLAWSGDTVYGDSRAAFDTAKEGFERMVKHVHDAKPSVVVLSFGINESFEGQAGLSTFIDGYKKLLDAIADTDARLIFLGAPRLENLGAPLPDPAKQNENVNLYNDAMRALASERSGFYIDLAGELEAMNAAAPLTYNTMHFTPYGYWVFAQAVLKGLGYDTPRFMAQAIESFTLAPEVFFAADIPADTPKLVRAGETLHTLRYFANAPGRYRLESDGKVLAEASKEAWEQGVAISGLPEVNQFEGLRAVVKEKNRLFFNQWRPQNETYIFGFRKHEQGQYAAEIPLFDPLIEAEEAKIAELKKPKLAHYTMARVAEVQ
jgi:lysophospholipase L1-like esterase